MASRDQGETIAFVLQNADAGRPPVQRLQTHISEVFIFADLVFKLKRAVKLPYLDFSTPQLREHFCQRELKLNRRTAPALYLAVRRITRSNDGALEFDGAGELVDALVEMRRFEQSGLFDAMARRGALDAATLTRLAQVIAKFHSVAETLTQKSGAQALEFSIATNEKGFAASSMGRQHDVQAVLAQCRERFESLRAGLDERSAAGFLRRCHGDLHLRNICLYEDAPVLFDGIEFDDRLCDIDVLFDLAFLLMDLLHLNLPQEANLVFNRYLDTCEDIEHLRIVPLFMAVRACVRAQIAAGRASEKSGDEQPDKPQPEKANIEKAKTEEAKTEAQAYIQLARDLLTPVAPVLIAVGGLSGSGKSTLAAALAQFAGPAPGARVLSTDRIRKALHGVEVDQRLPQSAYTPEESARVYETQRARAFAALRGGHAVIADGVFLRENERKSIASIAERAGVAFIGIWLDAPVKELSARVDARVGDPSDATSQVVARQAQMQLESLAENLAENLEWTRIDASQGPEQTLESARAVLRARVKSPGRSQG